MMVNPNAPLSYIERVIAIYAPTLAEKLKVACSCIRYGHTTPSLLPAMHLCRISVYG